MVSFSRYVTLKIIVVPEPYLFVNPLGKNAPRMQLFCTNISENATLLLSLRREILLQALIQGR